MREEILTIAEDQMKAGGFAHLNFGAISSQLGTTRANLHYHFKNKETLALEVTKRFIADQEADLRKTVAQFPGNFPGLMGAMEDWLWGHRECNGAVGACVCEQIIRQPEVPEALLTLAKEHFVVFRTLIVEQVIDSQESGTITKEVDAVQIALEAGCILMGLGQMSLFMEENELPLVKGTLKKWVTKYSK